MASPSTQALLFAGAVLTVLAALASGAGGAAAALAVTMLAAALVAFAAQSARLRDERRLVYRPVYARRRIVQRRLSSED